MEVRVNQIEKRSWIEINLAQLKKNYLCYKNNLNVGAEIMAVIKADAYGHGDVQVARVLYDLGVRLFAVSNVDEAVGLREAGIQGEILILGYTSVYYAHTLFNNDLTQTIVSKEYAHLLSETGLNIKAQFAIDTGMNRIGLNGDDPNECELIIREYAGKLNLQGCFTHLCVADSEDIEDKRFTCLQIKKFKDVVDKIIDLDLPFLHCYNSAGGLYYLNNREDLKPISKIVRLGIVLYGLKPDDSSILPEGIMPIMEWKSQISMVKDVYPGETIGYGRSFVVKKQMRIATVTTGYADGLNRLLSNKGFVLINGKKAPIVGKICMDQTLVDVTDIPDAQISTKVTLVGRCGDIVYTADDMARDLGTIGYEIICNITKRVQRFYVNTNVNM